MPFPVLVSNHFFRKKESFFSLSRYKLHLILQENPLAELKFHFPSLPQ